MKTIDLVVVDDALRTMMAEFGLEACSRTVDIEFWHYKAGGVTLKYLVTAFLDEHNCETAHGLDWQLAIDALRLKIKAYLKGEPDLSDVTVIVPEVVN